MSKIYKVEFVFKSPGNDEGTTITRHIHCDGTLTNVIILINKSLGDYQVLVHESVKIFDS